MLWRQATQTDVAMAGTVALSALSACTGGHAEIVIRGVWQKPHCLHTATIAAPGERKSAVQMTMVRPRTSARHRCTLIHEKPVIGESRWLVSASVMGFEDMVVCGNSMVIAWKLQ